MMTLKHLNDISEDEFDTFNDEDKKEFNRRSRDFKKALLERLIPFSCYYETW